MLINMVTSTDSFKPKPESLYKALKVGESDVRGGLSNFLQELALVHSNIQSPLEEMTSRPTLLRLPELLNLQLVRVLVKIDVRRSVLPLGDIMHRPHLNSTHLPLCCHDTSFELCLGARSSRGALQIPAYV